MDKIIQKTLAQGNYTLREDHTEQRYTLSVVPEGPVRLEKISAEFPFEFRRGDALFLNGYQSWTYSPERGTDGYDSSLKHCPRFLDRKFGFSRYGDGHFCPPEYRRGIMHGYTYAYVRRGNGYVLFASLAEKSGFTRIVFDTNRNMIVFEKDCESREISEEYPVFDMLFLSGTENEVFDRWFAESGISALPAEKATGYTSWYNCYQNISESRIESDLEGLNDLPVRPDIFQIDDGFESYVGDWLSADPVKFPNGTAPIAEKIIKAGYRAGIWLAPFVCETKSGIYRDHPDWLLRSPDGTDVYAGSNWSGAYALDFYNPEVREYIRTSIGKYINEGFTLFKLDFLYAACMVPRPDKTRGEIMDEAMAFLREVCGSAYIIACGVPLAPAFGKVEYCRIGPDITLDFDDKPFMRLFHAERPSTKRTVRNTVFRRQLSGRAFLNDPDVFLLRDDNTGLTSAQKAALGTINSLFGGLLFSSDEFRSYDDGKKQLFSYLCSLRDAEVLSVDASEDRIDVRYRIGGEEKDVSWNG